MARFLVGFVLLLTVLSSSLADEHKGVLYKRPAGWNQSLEGGAVVLAPKDLKEGDLLAVLIAPAAPATEDSPRKQFEKAVAGANEGDRVLALSEIHETSTAGVSLQVQQGEVEADGLGKHHRLYAMVLADKQTVFAIVIASREALLEKYRDALAELLGSLRFKEAPTAGGKIPTGDTPALFPGTAGWLPSGQGVPIPAAAVTNGRPVGLWWKTQVDTRGLLKPVVHVYMPDGVRASRPRLGGGRLFDVEGQKRQQGTTGVGTFTVAGGTMTESYDGFQNAGAFESGSDGSGRFFRLGGALFRPLVELTDKTLVGSWYSMNTEYRFHADGTYESGSVLSTRDWVAGSSTSGTYIVEGFLLMLQPKDAPIQIDFIGMGGQMLVKGSTFYNRR